MDSSLNIQSALLNSQNLWKSFDQGNSCDETPLNHWVLAQRSLQSGNIAIIPGWKLAWLKWSVNVSRIVTVVRQTAFFVLLTIAGPTLAEQQINPYAQPQYGYSPNSSGYPSVAERNNPINCDDRNWDGNCVCEQQRQKIAWVRSQGLPILGFDWSQIRSAQLVMIGDAHGVSLNATII